MRDKFIASIEKRRNVNECEAHGIVADSMDVRKALLDRVKSGEISLDQAQVELKKIKRSAGKNGIVTRSQAWNRG